MSDAEEVKFSLQVLINKQKTKVLFAEADSDFLDVLLSFLILPLGKIVKVLEKHYGDKALVIGSLTTLCNGLTNPNNAQCWTELGKQVLLNPRSGLEDAFCNLKVNVDYTLTMNCDFGKPYDGVFTKGTASFIIRDDLLLVPNVRGSIIQTLSDLGLTITDMDGAEIRNVIFGFNEIMDLLKGSLISQTPLSDLILDTRQMDVASVKYVPKWHLTHLTYQIEATFNYKMTLKVMVQKSTNKLLFAQAEDDFIDFLFSILTIPLGRVQLLLGRKNYLKNIDNLYRSIAHDFIDDKYMRTPDTKNWLMKPEVPHMYTSNQFLPLSEDCFCPSRPTNNQNYVKGPRMYMVTDDLTVTPLGITSSLSILNGMKISLSDVEELELQLEVEDALCILEASLISTAALTDALINLIVKKQAKQEH